MRLARRQSRRITRNMARNRKSRHLLGCLLFGIYLIALLYFLFFSEQFGRVPGEDYSYNLIPFREILRFWNNRETLGLAAVCINVLGNVIAFIPFGFFLPIVTKWKMNFRFVVLVTFFFSLAVECVQLVTRVGSFDVDDLILNTLGGLLGCVISMIRKAIRRRRHR
jgi:glycopeptide antibiotics resistance protein